MTSKLNYPVHPTAKPPNKHALSTCTQFYKSHGFACTRLPGKLIHPGILCMIIYKFLRCGPWHLSYIRMLCFFVFVCTAIVWSKTWLILPEISPWTGRFYSLLDPSYAKNNIPIIASVSEHQPTAWSSFYFDLQLLVFMFPGMPCMYLYVCLNIECAVFVYTCAHTWLFTLHLEMLQHLPGYILFFFFIQLGFTFASISLLTPTSSLCYMELPVFTLQWVFVFVLLSTPHLLSSSFHTYTSALTYVWNEELTQEIAH